MAYCKIEKGTELFQMFQDYWKLMQENWKIEDSEEYWQKVILDVDKFYYKYNTQFALQLAFAYLNELDRRYKERLV